MKKSELLQIIREEVGKALENPCLTKCKAKCTAVVKKKTDPGDGEDLPEDYDFGCKQNKVKCYNTCFKPCKDNCSKVDAKKLAKKEAEANKKKGPIASPPPKKVKPKPVPRKEDHCYKHSQCKCKNCYCDMSDTELVKDERGKPRSHGRCASKSVNTVDFD
jgi:hypothetical protein